MPPSRKSRRRLPVPRSKKPISFKKKPTGKVLERVVRRLIKEIPIQQTIVLAHLANNTLNMRVPPKTTAQLARARLNLRAASHAIKTGKHFRLWDRMVSDSIQGWRKYLSELRDLNDKENRAVSSLVQHKKGERSLADRLDPIRRERFEALRRLVVARQDKLIELTTRATDLAGILYTKKGTNTLLSVIKQVEKDMNENIIRMAPPPKPKQRSF